MRDRELSAKQRAFLAKVENARHRNAIVELSGFDGEHATARSLEKRGLVKLISVDRGGARMWRIE